MSHVKSPSTSGKTFHLKASFASKPPRSGIAEAQAGTGYLSGTAGLSHVPNRAKRFLERPSALTRL